MSTTRARRNSRSYPNIQQISRVLHLEPLPFNLGESLQQEDSSVAGD